MSSFGGAAGVPGRLFIQQKDGSFVESTQGNRVPDRKYEDWGALFFDAKATDSRHLYVASCGYASRRLQKVAADRHLHQPRGRPFARIRALSGDAHLYRSGGGG